MAEKSFLTNRCLSSGGNTLHGIVDIAIMQSCFNDHDVKSFVQDYGMVVVDECHHVPAFNFEQVLKHITARYVYGLTATPIRKDGHQPIIFMQCGPIRYSSDAKQQIQQQTFSRILVPRFTSYRFLSDEKLPYARQSQLLAEDEVRNNLIVQDIKDALNHQRTPIVLSDLTSHVLALAEKIQVFCPNVITLLGADSAKGKRETLLRLQNIPTTEPLVIVATGKYIGEGFDYPRLDTLFLAMPISWKGRVAQYAGRLHRVFDGKKDVQIFDYIDVHVPVYESMYRKRLRGYAAIGYIVQTETKTTKNISCSIFNGRTYFDEFAESIRQAKHSVLLSCPKISEKISRSMLSLLQSAITDGKDVLVVTSSQSSNIDQLSSYGISVRQVDNLSIRTAVIDCSLIWYGGVNFFGYSSEEDNIIQFESATLSKELLNSILY